MNTGLNIGFVGLGIMGAPMAGHLLAAGHRLFVHTRRPMPDALQQAGAVACANASAVAQQADIVFLMLPDTPDVATVLFGEGGVAAGHSLLVHSRRPLPPALQGAVTCANASAVAQQADIVFLMLPDTPDVAAVQIGRAHV